MALGDEQPYTAREVAPPETDAAKPGSIQQWLKGMLTLFKGEDADGNPVAAPQTRAPTFEQVDNAHTTATGSYVTALSYEVDSPRLLTEVMAYFRDTGGGGSATDWRLLIAQDSSLDGPDAPAGSLTDGDGWLEHDSGQIASGGDGPDISGPGYEVLTHLIVFQTQAVSAATTGRAQLTGRE